MLTGPLRCARGGRAPRPVDHSYHCTYQQGVVHRRLLHGSRVRWTPTQARTRHGSMLTCRRVPWQRRGSLTHAERLLAPGLGTAATAAAAIAEAPSASGARAQRVCTRACERRRSQRLQRFAPALREYPWGGRPDGPRAPASTGGTNGRRPNGRIDLPCPTRSRAATARRGPTDRPAASKCALIGDATHGSSSRVPCPTSPGADVAAASPVLVQMWQRRAQSRCRCGRNESSPGADVAGVSPGPRATRIGRPSAASACAGCAAGAALRLAPRAHAPLQWRVSVRRGPPRPHAAMRAAGRMGCVGLYVLRVCAPRRAGSVTAAATRCGSPPSSARLPSVAYTNTYIYIYTMQPSPPPRDANAPNGNTMPCHAVLPMRHCSDYRRGRASERTYTDRGQLIPRTRTRSGIPLT